MARVANFDLAKIRPRNLSLYNRDCRGLTEAQTPCLGSDNEAMSDAVKPREPH